MAFLRQHSSLSHSTVAGTTAEVAEEVTIAEEGDEEKPPVGRGAEPESTADQRHKLAKVTSTEDEVARLTVEVS